MFPPVAILAGGLATRLHPVTEKVPKALLPIAGQPFIFHQLDLLKKSGITQVVLCVGFLGEQVQDKVGDGKEFGMDIRYSFDGTQLLGTGGALKQAIPLLGPQFFVLYGDSYLHCPFQKIQDSFDADKERALMMVLHNNNQWDTSNVLFREGRVKEYNKHAPHPAMKHIDYGMSLLSAECLLDHKDKSFDLSDVYHSLSLQGQLAGFETTERFYEIGSRQGIRDIEELFWAKEKK